MIRNKSVHSAIDRQRDGFRVLVTRFWPRGLRRSCCDAWMPNLGPSERLLKDGQSGKIEWREFRRLYKSELFEGGTIDKRNSTIKNHGQKFTLRMLKSLAKRGSVTLMCYCPEEQTRCHRHLLHEILKRRL